MKRFLGLPTLIGLTLVLLSCSTGPSRLKHDPSKTVYRFPEGAELAALNDVKTDDVADILGIYRWKFKFTAPKDFTPNYHLELRQTGQAAKELHGYLVYNNASGQAAIDEEVLVALQPLGPDLRSSDKLKIFFGVRGSRGESQGTSVIDNPIKGRGSLSRGFPMMVENDGAFQLLSIEDVRNTYSSKKIFITLRVKLEPSRQMKQ